MEVKEPSAKYLARPKYKETDVGTLPADWNTVNLSSLLREGPTNGWSGPSAKDGRGTPTLSLAATTNGYLVLNDDTVKYLEDQIPRGSNLYLAPGDILVQRSNTVELVGTTALFDGPPDVFVYPDLMMRLRFRQAITAQWFWRFANSQRARCYFRSIAAGSTGTMPKISGAKLRAMPVPVPPAKEQEAVVKALSDADALIESLERLIAKKRQVKQGAMQELLKGKRRLPGFGGDWEVRALGDIATAKKGSQLSISEMTEHGTFAHLNGGISPSGYTYKSNTPGDSIAISEGGNSCGYVQFMFEPYWCGGHCYSVIPKGIDNRFLYHALKGEETAIMGLRVGSGLPNVQKTSLLALPIRCPRGNEEQTAIAAILSDMDADLSALEERLAKARQLKQGMMQELLTGRIRLVQPESNVVQLTTRKELVSASAKSHNWQINEAVVIAVLAKNFGTERFPLGRKRCTKLSYLLHRHVERAADGYLKKAAGPYNPDVKYKGPEGIAQKSRYVRTHRSNQYSGFVAGENIAQAEAYFAKWYGDEPLTWLEQFRRKTNDELELLATVDMALVDLRNANKAEQLAEVKKVIRDHPDWEAKLDRAIFSDENIASTMNLCKQLFDYKE